MEHLPPWVWELLLALHAYEDTHDKGNGCIMSIIEKHVPPHLWAALGGFRDLLASRDYP